MDSLSNTTSVLIHFRCNSCKYEESIGVAVQTGIILRGEITCVCPKCGNIVVIPNVMAIVPVRIGAPRG